MTEDEARAVVRKRLAERPGLARTLLGRCGSDPELERALLAGATEQIRWRVGAGELELTAKHVGQILWRLGIASRPGPDHQRWWVGE